MTKLNFSIELRDKIVAMRQEIEASKVRHNVELEKIQVLTEYYNKKIIEMMEKEKVQRKFKTYKTMAAISNLIIDQGANFSSDVRKRRKRQPI